MKIPDKLYEVLKWLAIIALPAVDTCLLAILPALNVPDTTTKTVVTIISAVATLIGALIGISTVNYNKEDR